MSALLGTWNLSLKTPIGTLPVQYHFDQTVDHLHGTATSTSETVPLENITVDPIGEGDGGLHVTWRQKVSKPMRLHLDFDVTVVGDTMTGHSRAGRLPRTSVTGQRVNP